MTAESIPAAPDAEARKHAVELEQWSLFVDSDPLRKAMTDAAKFLRKIAEGASRPDPAPAGVEEAVARAICRARDLNPDCLHQHHEWENFPTDASEEVGPHFDNPAFTRLMHYGWRHHVVAARAAIAAMPASRTDEEAIRRAVEDAEVQRCLAWFLRCEYDGDGLVDCIDNEGKRYPSQDLTDCVKASETALTAARLRAEKAAAGGEAGS